VIVAASGSVHFSLYAYSKPVAFGFRQGKHRGSEVAGNHEGFASPLSTYFLLVPHFSRRLASQVPTWARAMLSHHLAKFRLI
jgi:hypothetical protein